MLEAVHLTRTFSTGVLRQPVRVLENVCFSVSRGETLGLLGRSGSGKSTIARMLAGLSRPDAGEVRLNRRNINALSGRNTLWVHQNIQMIFQDPHQALDPKKTIAWTLREPLLAHGIADSKPSADRRILKLFAETGLSREIRHRYPHEISGGQAQRVVIARALSLSPRFLIADEPTSMLDLSIQAMILNLLSTLQRKRNLGIVLISHDPAVLRKCCHRVLRVENRRVLPDKPLPEASFLSSNKAFYKSRTKGDPR